MNQKPVYRMSESGSCPKVLGAIRLGYEPIPETKASLRVMREGQRHEDFVIEDLIEQGYEITDRQKEVSLETPILTLQGHIDGIARDNSKSYLLEIKALGRFTCQKYQSKGLVAFPEYQAQVSCYSEALKLPILFVVKNRDTGEIIKTELPEPPMTFDSIIDKLTAVELCIIDNVLPEAEYRDDSDQCHWCRFKYLCLRPEVTEKIKTEDLPSLLEAAQLYKEGRELAKQSEERLEQAKATFLTHSKANQINKFRVSNVSFSYQGERVKEWLDEKIIRAEAPPELIEKALRKSKPYDAFTIRILEEKK